MEARRYPKNPTKAFKNFGNVVRMSNHRFPHIALNRYVHGNEKPRETEETMD